MLPLLLLLAPTASPAWTWPLAPPSVVRPYAPGPAPWSPGHRGADLAGAPGQAVLAAGAGRVSYAGLLAGRGVVVVVHGDLRTTYEPVAAGVAVGQAVTAGQVLGVLSPGHEGCPAPACLHWGLRRGEAYLDPVGLVAPGPVRLLPLTLEGRAEVGVPGPGATVPPVGAPPPPDLAPTPVPVARSGRPRAGPGLTAAGLLGAAVLLALRRP